MGSVIANKKALAVSQDLYDQIKGPHMWQEATVSSAVSLPPVWFATSMRDLMDRLTGPSHDVAAAPPHD